MPRGLAEQWLAEALEEAPLRLKWRLVAEIRGAKRNGEAQVYAILHAAMLARLREVNPKLLDEAGEGTGDVARPR